jgi:hypothetical protein
MLRIVGISSNVPSQLTKRLWGAKATDSQLLRQKKYRSRVPWGLKPRAAVLARISRNLPDITAELEVADKINKAPPLVIEQVPLQSTWVVSEPTKIWPLAMGSNGAKNQEWLCWQKPATIYCPVPSSGWQLSMEAARGIPLLQAKAISNKYMIIQQTRITWSVL